MTTLTREERQAFAGLIQDPDELKYLETFMRIPNKSREDVKFSPWPVQRRLITNLGPRNVWVKDSQCGSTSIAEGVFTKRTITIPNTTTVIIAHDEFTTGRLLHKAQTMYNSIPKDAKPRQDHSSTYEMRFPDINSVMYIATARASVAGRGEPIHNLLLSEAAFYQEGAKERIVIPALQRVPPDGCVIIESTPNGEDDILFVEIQKFLNHESTFRLQIVYWWDNPDNVLPSGSELAFPEEQYEFEYTDKEQDLINLHDCSRASIRWRRWKIREAGELFFQEHLEDLGTCFLITGTTYYPGELLKQMTAACYPAPHSGPGNSEVWFPPEPGGTYVMGSDPGQGKSTNTSHVVVRIFPPAIGDEPSRGPRVEAKLSGLFEAAERKDDAIELAKWYNNTLINPEANGHGQGFIREIKNWSNLYWREDIVSGRKTMVIGWLTTTRTKPFMLQTIKRTLPTLECYDREMIRQLRGFRDQGEGKVLPTTADDDHDALGLALVAAGDVRVNSRKGFKGSSGYTSWDKGR